MNEAKLRALLRRHRSGKIETDDLLRELRHLPFTDLGFAHVDHHRALRCGFPEVIFCERKTAAQIGKIAASILERQGSLLATRATPEAYGAIAKIARGAKYHDVARCVTVGKAAATRGYVSIVTAGTSDIPVAEEARVTAEAMGARVKSVHDVGVAGLHRLLGRARELMDAEVVIAVAGMEGALASVVGGLVRRPVIAVPTSVGYGASFKGLSALLTMLNSCAAGVSVVNIDNGFGAGYLAAMIVTSARSRPRRTR